MTAVVLESLLSSEVTERLLGGREEFKPGRSHIHLWLRFHSHWSYSDSPSALFSMRAIILCMASVSRTAHTPHKSLTEINLTEKPPFFPFSLRGRVSRGQAGARSSCTRGYVRTAASPARPATEPEPHTSLTPCSPIHLIRAQSSIIFFIFLVKNTPEAKVITDLVWNTVWLLQWAKTSQTPLHNAAGVWIIALPRKDKNSYNSFGETSTKTGTNAFY